jgi:hypothetical protein
MNKILAIIDADSLTYYSSKGTIEDSIQNINERIENIFNQTQCTHYCMFISKGKYFRHLLSPLYKSQRKSSDLKYLKTLKSYLIEQWNAQWMDGVEADDLTAYYMNKNLYYGAFQDSMKLCGISDDKSSFISEPELVKKVLCAIDKDLLKSIPATHPDGHFNYTYKLTNPDNLDSLIKGYWVKPINANRVFWESMICGDDTDNIKGIEGKGIAFATKLFDECDKNEDNYYCATLHSYISRYGESDGIFQFQKNFRLLHMLSTDEDFIREIGKLPTFQIITEVKREVSIEKQIEDLI